jgi:hypothetical protein
MTDQNPSAPEAGASGNPTAAYPATLGELRSGTAFENQVVHLVEAQMTGHLEAGSVDEWHHKLLDDLVSHAVSVESLLIEEAGSARRALLLARLAAEELAITELHRRANEAAEIIRPTQAQVALAEARLLPHAADTLESAALGMGGSARLAQVRTRIAEMRSAMASTMQQVGVTSSAAIPEAIGNARAQEASLSRRIEEQHRRADQARMLLENAESAPTTESFAAVEETDFKPHAEPKQDLEPSEEDLPLEEVA